MAGWGWDGLPDIGLGAAVPPEDADRPLEDDEVAEALEALGDAPAFRAAMERLHGLALDEPEWCGVELTAHGSTQRRRFLAGRTAPVRRRWAVVSCWLGDGEPRVLLDLYEARAPSS